MEAAPSSRSAVPVDDGFPDKVGDVKLAAMPGRMGRMGAGLAALPKAADGFYQSKEWLALRARRMADADYREAKARAGGGRVILDHISERRDGGADLDPANTQWLTMAEHQAKTARVRAERAARRGAGSKSAAMGLG